jgi:hypothetical protein
MGFADLLHSASSLKKCKQAIMMPEIGTKRFGNDNYASLFQKDASNNKTSTVGKKLFL